MFSKFRNKLQALNMQKGENNIISWLYKALCTDYWNFSGRARRREFWYVIFLQAFVGVVCTTLHYAYFRFVNEFFVSLSFYGIAYVYLLLTIIPTISVHVRRLHDAGKTGWWHPAGISFILNITFGLFLIVVVFIYGLVVLLFYQGKAPFESDIIDMFFHIISFIVALILFGSIIVGITFLFFDSERGHK